MKHAPLVAALVLALSLPACSSGPAQEPLRSDALKGITLGEAKSKLSDAEVTYEVKVIGSPGMVLPEDATSWETVGLMEQKDRNLRAGESVTLYVKPKVWPRAATPTPTPTPTPEKKIVTFVVNADGPIESATYAFDVGTKNTEEEVANPAAPFAKEVTLTQYEYENSKSFSVQAWPGAGTTTISCQILVNGIELDSSSATGTGSFVTCLKLKF